jgi:hypothetical protein
MGEREIIERTCEVCGKQQQHTAHVAGEKFRGWWGISHTSNYSCDRFCVCSVKCLVAFAKEQSE